MSEELERKVVTLEFDNKKFDRNIKKSQRSLESFKKSLNLDKSIKSFEELEEVSGDALTPFEKSITVVEKKLTAMEMVAFAVINRITNKIIDMGEKFVSSMSIDQITSGWAKYESQISSMQTLVHALNQEVEGESAYGFNFANDEDRVAYVEKYQDALSRFYDETSADAMAAMKIISNYASQQIPLGEAEKAVYGIYSLVASAGQPLSSVADAANVFTKTLGRKFMSGDYFSLSTRMLDTSEFKQLVLDTATEVGELEKVGDKYYRSQNASNATGIVGGLNAGIVALGNFKSGVSDTEVTLSTFKDTLSEGWLSGKTMSAALAKMGEFWTVLEPIIAYTEEMDDTGKAEYIGATQWSKWIRQVTKVRKIEEGMSVEEQTEILEEQADARQDFIDKIVAQGYAEDTAVKWYNEIMDDQLTVSRNAFLALQEAKSFSEAVDATKVGVATRFSTIFQSLAGDYLQAREIFTDFSEWLYGYFVKPMDVVADAFKEWSEEGGFDFLYKGVDGARSLFGLFSDLAASVAKPFHDVFTDVLGISKESIKEKIQEIVEKIYSFVQSLILTEEKQNAVASVLKMIISVFRTFGKVIGFVWKATEPLRSALSLIWDVVVNLVTSISDGISALLEGEEATEEATGFFSIVEDAVTVIIGLIYSVIDAVKSLFDLIKESEVLNSIKEFVIKAAELIGGGVVMVGNAAAGLFDKIAGYFKGGEANSFASKIYGFFSKASETIRNKLSGKGKTLSEELIGDPEDARDQLNAVSKEIAKGKKSGKVEMLDLAGKNGVEAPKKKSVMDVAKNVGAGIVGFLAGIVGTVASVVKESKDGIKSIVSDLFDIARDGVKNVWNYIKELIIDALDFIQGIMPKLLSIAKDISGVMIFLAAGIGALNIARLPGAIDTAIAGNARAKNKLGVAAIVASVAVLVLSIVGSILLMVNAFEKYDTGTILASLGVVLAAMGAMLTMIGFFIALLTKFANIKMPTTFNITGLNLFKKGSGLLSGSGEYVQNDNGLYSVAVIIGCVIALLWSVVGALYLLQDVPTETIWRNFGVLMLSMAILLGLVTATTTLIGKFANLEDPWIKGGIGTGGITGERHGDSFIGRVGGVIWGCIAMLFAVVGALKMLDTIDDVKDPNKIWRLFGVLILSVTAVLAMITILYGVVAAINKSRTKISEMESVLGARNDTLVQSLGTSGSGPLAELNKVIIALSLFMLSFALTAKILSKVPDNAQSFVKSMMGMMGAIVLIMVVIVGVVALFAKNNVDYQSYAKVLTKVGSLMKSMAWTLVIVAIGMAALIGAAMLAYYAVVDQNGAEATLNGGKLAALISVFVVAGAIMAAMFLMAKSFTKKGNDSEGLIKAAGMFIVMSLFLTSIAGFMAVLVLVASLLHKKQALNEFGMILLGIIVVVGAFVSMIKVLEKVSGTDMLKIVGFFTLFGVVIAALAAALSSLVGPDWESLLAVTLPLSMVISGFIVMMKTLESVKASQLLSASATFVAFALAVGIISQALVTLSELDQDKFDKAFKYLLTMVVVAGVITVVLSAIGSIYEGLGAVILLAAGAAFALVAVGICLLAEAFVIFGKGLSELARGIQSFNGVNFDGLVEFSNIIFGILKDASGIILLIGAIGTFFGAGFAVVILSIAGAIAIVVNSIAKLIEVLVKLFAITDSASTEQFTDRITQLCNMLVTIFEIVGKRLVLMAQSIGAGITEGLVLGIISALKVLTEDDRLYTLGYLLADALYQLIGGLMDGFIEKLEEKILDGYIKFLDFSIRVGEALGLDESHIKKERDALKEELEANARGRYFRANKDTLLEGAGKGAISNKSGEKVPSASEVPEEPVVTVRNNRAGILDLGLGGTAAAATSNSTTENVFNFENTFNLTSDGDDDGLVDKIVDALMDKFTEKARGLMSNATK